MFQPLHDYILIEKPLTQEISSDGIYIPETAKEHSSIATVLAVGPGKWVKGQRIAPRVNVGDKLLISKKIGVEFKTETNNYILIKEENIIAVLKD